MSDYFNSSLAVPSVQVVPASDLQDLWNFKYSPFNASLPLLACAIFFTCASTHLCIALITKRFYMLPLTVGCILGIIGEVFKIICVISTSAPKALNYYVLYSLVTDLAPCVFLTSIGYMVRRMMNSSATQESFPWPTRVITQQIITLEIVAFSLQSYGLLVQANPLLSHYWNLGNLVTVLGSTIELINIFLVWMSLWIVMRKRRLRTTVIAHQQSSTNFSAFAKVIAGSVTFVLLRTLSRLALHLKNAQLEPFRNELLIFLLEGLPLGLCAVFLIIFHPCRFDGGIPEQTPSFYSPDAPMGGPVECEMMEESRSLPIDHPISRSSCLHEDMGPFWTVPLSPQKTGKRASAHVRLVEPEEHIRAQLEYRPSNPTRDLFSPNGMSDHKLPTTRTQNENPEQEDIGVARLHHTAEEDPPMIGTGNGEVRIRRRTHSAVSFDKNPLAIAEFHNDGTKSSRRSPNDGYSISSYYDGASKNFAKDWADEIFHKNVDNKFGAWDEESVYSTEESGKSPSGT
ncbi:hypothetical protein PSTG_00009 [Puccinia striiformis f. sp. tritici PST-78]|uniref:Uncharacterized protein n=1 Tax=Puccinia striiformis f. sp. tritici PST-78 TaxID=1165861 RepID=A0A0L0W582_9BASI|nr:hypothetical protein PSTG_00009 [Puccinia striiformis f. sp. tritici PST-78]